MREHNIGIRLSSAELKALDRVPGSTNPEKIRYLLQVHSIADLLTEQFRKETTALAARISMLEKRIDEQPRAMSQHELRKILTTFASAFSLLLPDEHVEKMRGITKKIKAGAYAAEEGGESS